MDQFNQPYHQPPYAGRRSERMELAALVLGIIAIVSCACLYLSLPCGALAIVFASLSRGGAMQYSSRSQIGMILGILALTFTILIYGVSIAYAFYEYGSLEGILKAYSEMSGIDYMELMHELYPNLY